MKIDNDIIVLVEFLTRTQIYIFRVTIFMLIWLIINGITTLNKKVTSDPSFL